MEDKVTTDYSSQNVGGLNREQVLSSLHSSFLYPTAQGPPLDLTVAFTVLPEIIAHEKSLGPKKVHSVSQVMLRHPMKTPKQATEGGLKLLIRKILHPR